MPVRAHARLTPATLAMLAAAALDPLVPATPSAFDHAAWGTLLRTHVTAGLVDYDAFARSAEFGAYLQRLASAQPKALPPADRLAFWINAYNAYTIQQVNAHGERRSIRNIRTTLGGRPLEGPWSEPMVRAAGRTLTLDEVEHEIIRKQFREPRIHFALVCAALGCPPLRSEAYVGARLEEQLEDQARAFLLRSPGKNRVDAASRTVFVSPILVWYRDDFGGGDASIARFLARYWPEGEEKRLLASGAFDLRETDYDWTLNSVARHLPGKNPAPPGVDPGGLPRSTGRTGEAGSERQWHWLTTVRSHGSRGPVSWPGSSTSPRRAGRSSWRACSPTCRPRTARSWRGSPCRRACFPWISTSGSTRRSPTP